MAGIDPVTTRRSDPVHPQSREGQGCVVSEPIVSVLICVVGLAALGVFAAEVFRPRSRREERSRLRRERRDESRGQPH